jgi:glucose-1-phosphate thymidylyltransferase
MTNKGIVLAGGAGTRLHPVTKVVSKQLMPVYDKPMVYYPIGTLMMAGIRDILIISTPHDLPLYSALLGDGSKWGVSFSYEQQQYPGGIAQAFIIGKNWIRYKPVALILGDNIFYGHGLDDKLQMTRLREKRATIFAYRVRDPKRYGVVEFSGDGKVISIEEKPDKPKSNYAVPGLYFYDECAVDYVVDMKPSARGELEITDLNLQYLKREKLFTQILGRGYAWLDTGSHESLQQASNFVETIEQRQGLKILCPEEIAFNNKWITDQELFQLGQEMENNPYGQYLIQIATDERR